MNPLRALLVLLAAVSSVLAPPVTIAQVAAASAQPRASVKVPAVIGLTKDQASTAIAAAELDLGSISYQSSDQVSRGDVISESPEAGSSTQAHSQVNLVVSLGWKVVPQVIGSTKDAATQAIQNADLHVGLVSYKASTSATEGLVISESPAANSRAYPESLVNLIISLGWRDVPQVMGSTLDAATQVIQNAGLDVGLVSYKSGTNVAKGLVISESPAASTRAYPHSQVNLVISKGGQTAPKVTVPNVVGDTKSAATTAITGAGLTVGAVTTQVSTSVASGLVISESPFAGTSVGAGSAVGLVVSSGTAKVTVPNVVGDTKSAATTAITGAGLTVGAVTTQVSTTVKSGLVISENPTAGSSVAASSAVQLVLSSGAGTVGELPAEHALAQTGLAIGLASTVLQSQLLVLGGFNEAIPVCTALPGGGSVKSGSTDSTVTVFYDTACAKPYVEADGTFTNVTDPEGNQTITVVETATYFGLTDRTLGTLTLKEQLGSVANGDTIVHGLGIFTPTAGAHTPVQLGLYCDIPSLNGFDLACAGGIAQDFPALGLSLGAVSPLSLVISTDAAGSLTFSGSGSTVVEGSLGALLLTAPAPTSMVITGGTTIDSYTTTGSAAAFSLFPPPPTGWTMVDAANDLQLEITLLDNTTRNLSLTITQTVTGTTVASATIDQSGTGKITYSDGSAAAVTNWTLAD